MNRTQLRPAISICYLAARALATGQLSNRAEWQINQLLSGQAYTTADLRALDCLLDALGRGEVLLLTRSASCRVSPETIDEV